MDTIVRSAVHMTSTTGAQSGFWVGPRLILSTLHIKEWKGKIASYEECEALRKSGEWIYVESEITSKVIDMQHSPVVQLIEYDVEADIGLFRLMDQYPPAHDWVRTSWMWERKEMHEFKTPDREWIACVGYNGRLTRFQKDHMGREWGFNIRRERPDIADIVSLILNPAPCMSTDETDVKNWTMQCERDAEAGNEKLLTGQS